MRKLLLYEWVFSEERKNKVQREFKNHGGHTFALMPVKLYAEI